MCVLVFWCLLPRCWMREALGYCLSPPVTQGQAQYPDEILELLAQASLLENGVCCVPRFDLSVYGDASIGYRTVPYIVVAFSMAFKVASILRKNCF